MIRKWTIKYWGNEEFKVSLEAWFDQRNKAQLKSVAKELALLERSGNTLRLPHSKSLGKGLFELRERSFGFRIYYAFFPNGEIVLLHAGDKDSQTKDIKVAYNRLNNLIEKRYTHET